MRTIGSLCLFAFLLSSQERTLFRSPAVSRTRIVFVYAGDLWSVPRAGGETVRLTSSPGVESNPVFSPDGATIAFTGQYDGNVDIYTIPATGGVPKRITYHPGPDIVHGWSPDGRRILYTNQGSLHNSAPRLFTVDVNGGFPEEIPLPMGTMGAFSPDGTRIVYAPIARANQIWKNYRGGRATPLWIATLADSSVVKIPRADSNDHSPMWVGNKIYFISDRDGRDSLYEYDTGSKKVTRLIENKDLDIKAANACADAITYEKFGEIHLYDLKSKKDSLVKIQLNADLAGVRPRLEKTVRNVANFEISPSGMRAVFEARGDIYTVPGEKGDIRNLTHSPGVADRDPSWSPDGRSIAFFSDEGGEYQLHIRQQSGMGEVKKIPLAAKPSFFYGPTWSPDSKKIAYADKQLNLWYIDLDKGEPVRVDHAIHYGSWGSYRPVWSPDSKWIAFNRALKSGLAAVFVYSLDSGQATQITDGMSDARYATWDANGKYLYFAASTDAGPFMLGLDLSNTNRPATRSIYLVVLRKDDPSPFAPESDDEKTTEEKKPDAAKPAEGAKPPEGAKPDAKKVEVKIDLEGIEQRIVALPLPARNYDNLKAGKTGILFYREAPVVRAAITGPASFTVHKFDLSKRKSEVFQTGAVAFRISSNGEKILMAMGAPQQQGPAAGGPPAPPTFILTGTAATPKPGEGVLKLDGMETMVDPVAEWNQMYKEAWRIERDYFYDPKHREFSAGMRDAS